MVGGWFVLTCLGVIGCSVYRLFLLPVGRADCIDGSFVATDVLCGARLAGGFPELRSRHEKDLEAVDMLRKSHFSTIKGCVTIDERYGVNQLFEARRVLLGIFHGRAMQDSTFLCTLPRWGARFFSARRLTSLSAIGATCCLTIASGDRM